MPTGKIKFLNPKSGFGFIVENESGKEIYVHIKDILGSLEAGDDVEFELVERKRGPAAVQVRKRTTFT